MNLVRTNVLLFSLAGLFFAFGVVRSAPSLRDFKGFKMAFFDEETGLRYLQVGYEEAYAEKPKIGFLRMGLAFLKVRGLQIEMNARHAKKESLLELFQKVVRKRGVRYAVAEPIALTITTPSGESIKVLGDKGKFTSSGSLQVWGKVELVRGETHSRLANLSLSTDPSSNALILSLNKGSETISIPLQNQDSPPFKLLTTPCRNPIAATNHENTSPPI